jgi:acyl carrier protein
VVLLDEIFGIRVTEGDDPSYMRSVNTLTSFVIARLGETTNGSATGADKE